jgi:HEAT repeat protein
MYAVIASLALALGPASIGGLDGLDRVRAVLERDETTARAPGEDELVRRLAALGDEAAPALFALVRGPGLDELLQEGDQDRRWWCPIDRIDDVALAALAQAPPRKVVERLHELTTGEPDLGAHLAEARVLAALRSSLGLPRLLEIVGALELELFSPAVRSTLSEAFIALLEADLRSFTVLENGLANLGPAQKLFLCETLVASRRPQAADLLERMIEVGGEVRLSALEGLVSLAAQVPWRVHLDVAGELRSLQGVEDARVRAMVLSGYGRLADCNALPVLIGALEDRDAGVRKAAHGALVKLSGRRDLATVEQWNAWRQSETQWWRDQGQPQLLALAADEAQMAAVLRATIPHPVARVPLAEALITLMPGLSPDAQRMACGTLGRLGLPQAIPALIGVLFGAEGRTREAAWQALRALSGESLPAEGKLWESWAFG